MSLLSIILGAAASTSGPFRQEAKLTADAPAADDRFGLSVAVSGDGLFCAVSSHTDDNSGGTDAGSVYIFIRTGSTWTQQARLQASDAAASDNFGLGAVALNSDGTTCAICAQNDDNTGGSNAGSVYIFTRSGSTWTQQSRVQASDAAANDNFGDGVALSDDGNTMAVGCALDTNAGGTNAGSVYIFTRSAGVWTQQTRLQASDAAAGDYFGSAVALSSDGNTLAIGAISEDNAGGTNAGSAYVFTRSAGIWTQQAKVLASDGASNDGFGSSVALSDDGDTMAVGAYADDNAGGTDAGAVYVYTRSAGVWTQQAKLTASDGAAFDNFGGPIGLSSNGNVMVVGSTYDDTAAGSNAGSAYVFTRSGSVWTQAQKLTPADAAASDIFGSVSLSSNGRHCLVGAWQKSSSAGAAYHFMW